MEETEKKVKRSMYAVKLPVGAKNNNRPWVFNVFLKNKSEEVNATRTTYVMNLTDKERDTLEQHDCKIIFLNKNGIIKENFSFKESFNSLYQIFNNMMNTKNDNTKFKLMKLGLSDKNAETTIKTIRNLIKDFLSDEGVPNNDYKKIIEGINNLEE